MCMYLFLLFLCRFSFIPFIFQSESDTSDDFTMQFYQNVYSRRERSTTEDTASDITLIS